MFAAEAREALNSGAMPLARGRDERDFICKLLGWLGRGQSRRAGFQPAVSQCFQPADAPTDPARPARERSADWKSAIQQVGNLRYAELAGLFQRLWALVVVQRQRKP